MIYFKIYEDRELYDYLVDYKLEDPWEKIEELSSRLKYFDGKIIDDFNHSKHYYFCVLDDEKIVGMIKFKSGGQDSCFHPCYKNWVDFISIDEKYRGLHLSTKLIHLFYDFCKKHNFSVLMSGYSTLGWERVKDNFRKLAQEYKIDFLDDRTEVEFYTDEELMSL